jgi:hypothetical protein
MEDSNGAKRIKTMICYICQKEFNIKKIQNHLIKCNLNWTISQSFKKPEYRMPPIKEPTGFREKLLFAISTSDKKKNKRSSKSMTLDKFRASFDMPISVKLPSELFQYDKFIQENNDKAKIMNLKTNNPIFAKLYGDKPKKLS